MKWIIFRIRCYLVRTIAGKTLQIVGNTRIYGGMSLDYGDWLIFNNQLTGWRRSDKAIIGSKE